MGFFDNSITDTIHSFGELSKDLKLQAGEISKSIQFDTNDFKRSTQKILNELNYRITEKFLEPYGRLANTLNFYIEIISILLIVLLVISILCKVKQLFSSNNKIKNK